jgi:hypothetical protein
MTYVFHTDVMSTGAANPSQDGPRLAKGLSEFFAKVLDQLLLSSWLASAALVVTGVYLFALRAELDKPTTCAGKQCWWPHTLTEAGQRLSHMTLGGAVVILAVIIVTTMLTQAFTFEAIRTLEGYWAANRALKKPASWGVSWHKWRKGSLQKRLDDTDGAVRESAFVAIRAKNSMLVQAKKEPLLTPDQLEVLLAGLEHRAASVTLTDDDEYVTAVTFDWERHADPQLQLTKAMLSDRLKSFPDKGWLMPTKLGNILRRSEQNLGVDDVEPFVQNHFDELPASLQRAHDDERSRLDLYCAVVFLIPALGALAVPVLWGYPKYITAVELLVVFLTVIAYRAAIASGRAYGSVLTSIGVAVNSAAQNAEVGPDGDEVQDGASSPPPTSGSTNAAPSTGSAPPPATTS